VDEDGIIKARVIEVTSTAEGRYQQRLISEIQTTTKDCNWSVYASAKPSRSDVLINRARPVSMSSDDTVIRIGSQVFLRSSHPDLCYKHFDVPQASLYGDHVERQKQFVCVTSRQKTTKVSDPFNEQDKKIGNGRVAGNTTSGDTPDDKRQSTKDSSSESDSSGTNSSSEVESEALSAYESWSAASTDNSDWEVPQPIHPKCAPIPRNTAADTADGTPSDRTDDTSSDSNNESDASNTSDSDDEIVVVPNERYAQVMDEDEQDLAFQMLYDGGLDRPKFDGDEYEGAFPSDIDEDEAYEDGIPNNMSDDGSSSNEEDEVDKEDDRKKKEELIDGVMAKGDSKSKSTDPVNEEGATNAQLSKVETQDTKDKPEEDTEKELEAVGETVSQLHVYEISSDPPQRVFRFMRGTSQLVRDSPPAFHPHKSLVVWPLGDNNILFADYKFNTYFIRKLRPSRSWSQHVAIECHFSAGGDYIHIAALEMQRYLPKKPRSRKSKTDNNKDQAELEKDKQKREYEKARPECDLLIATYRLSQRKTTRAPPVLVHRVQLSLGRVQLAKGLPTFTWAPGEIYVAYSADDELKVYRIGLFNVQSSRDRSATPVIHAPGTPITIKDSEAQGEICFHPPGAARGKAKIVITGEQPKLETITVHDNKNGNEDASNSRDVNVDSDTLETIHEKSALGATGPLGLHNDRQEIRYLYVDIEKDYQGWRDAAEIGFGQGIASKDVGKMDMEAVPFDQSEDCDCCDD